MIVVVNKRHHKSTPYDQYIGRGSPLGNRWSHIARSQISRDHLTETRAEALTKYKEWLLVKLADENSAQCKMFLRLVRQARDGALVLVCFCKPQECEGDLIKRLIENLLGT